LGGGAFLEAVGLSSELARTLMAVLVIAFAATSLDTATRIQRFILSELGAALRIKPLTNRYIATIIAVVPAMYLALAETPDPATGQARAVGWVLWPIFGASNQLLAALTLMTLSLYFFARKRPVWPLVIPMVLVMPIAALALVTKLQQFLAEGNAPLAALATLLLVLLLWMIVEGIIAVRRLRHA
ncbi:MAG: carbon starvation protein A, partial [Deltaproteobacteria bacterium]|nr:carbon starvation protein A [Deltaproteobacteria bacterium]